MLISVVADPFYDADWLSRSDTLLRMFSLHVRGSDKQRRQLCRSTGLIRRAYGFGIAYHYGQYRRMVVDVHATLLANYFAIALTMVRWSEVRRDWQTANSGKKPHGHSAGVV